MKLTKSQLKEIIREEIKSMNENHIGYSLKKLPKMVGTALRGVWNWEKNKQYDLAIKGIEKWVSKNIPKLENQMSVYKASNSGRDLEKFAKMLETDSNKIIKFIDTQWDEIESEL